MTAPKSEVREDANVYRIFGKDWSAENCFGKELDCNYKTEFVTKTFHDQEVQALKEESADKDKRIAELEKNYELYKSGAELFIKTRNERIEHLEKALRDIAEHNTLNGNKYNNHVAAYEGVVEFAAKALSRKEV